MEDKINALRLAVESISAGPDDALEERSDRVRLDVEVCKSGSGRGITRDLVRSCKLTVLNILNLQLVAVALEDI